MYRNCILVIFIFIKFEMWFENIFSKLLKCFPKYLDSLEEFSFNTNIVKKNWIDLVDAIWTKLFTIGQKKILYFFLFFDGANKKKKKNPFFFWKELLKKLKIIKT